MVAEGLIDPEDHFYGTINCDGVNSKGEICGVTTTWGLAWKIPGRVGDSPILGAGLYVDGAVGAAGLDRTWRGEPLQPVLVPHRRRDAARQTPQGRRHGGAEADRRQHRREAPGEHTANPNFGINFYVVNARGDTPASPCTRARSTPSARDAGPQTLNCEPLLPPARPTATYLWREKISVIDRINR